MPLETFESLYALSLWKGLPLSTDFIKAKVPAASLRDDLPDFELRDFGTPPSNNPRLRSIWRMPFKQDENERPVAVVSEQYELLQHRVLATWLTENLSKAGLENAMAEITMTQFGERVRITIPLKDQIYDIAGDLLYSDKYRPEIEIINSVDRSSAFHVVLRWRRLICLNGMFTPVADRLRSIHRIDLSRTSMVRDFIKERLAKTPNMVAALSEWKKKRTSKSAAQAWCEKYLRSQYIWTVENCARLWWILETGYDGEVTLPNNKRKKHNLCEYTVGQHKEVPGVYYPVQTAYDLAQILTWITSNQRTVEMQIEGTEAVPDLMAKFIKFDKTGKTS